MSRSSKRRTPAQARAAARAPLPGLTPRNVVLAGLGAVSIGRRKATAALGAFAAGAADLPVRARDAVVDVGQQLAFLANQAEAQLAPLRRQAEAKLAPLRRQAEAFARDAEREFTTVATPVLAKLGIADAPARKTAARKPAARRPAAARKRTPR